MQGYPEQVQELPKQGIPNSNTAVRKSPKITAFTGLRGLAVIFVMLYHWFPSTVKGGFLGVSLFLSLSGYLVTDSFLRTYKNTGKLQIGSFYLRRLQRLYPSLIFFLLVLTTWLLLVQPHALLNYRANFLSTLGGYNNWWQVTQNLSYFDLHGSVNPLTHMWTMGLEMQYYLVWPVIMLIIAKIGKEQARFTTFFVSAIFALLSYISMIVLYALNFPVTRVYYGTDTRAFSFLLGAMLAGLLSSERLRRLSEYLSRKFLDSLALACLAIIIAMFWFVPGTSGFTYYFGIFGFTVLSIILMTCIADRKTTFGLLFSFRPLVALGKRSYALYLWQYAIMVLAQDLLKFVKISYGLSVFLQTVIVFILSEITYRFIEQNSSGLARFLLSPEPYKGRKKSGSKTGWIAAFVVFLFLLSSTTVALIQAPTGQAGYAKELADRISGQQVTTGVKGGLVEVNIGTTLSLEEAIRLINPESPSITNTPPTPPPAPYHNDQAIAVNEKYPELTMDEVHTQMLKGLKITCVGDSLAASAQNELKVAMPHITVDGKVSRQFPDGIDILRELRDSGELEKNILFTLGTNGVLNDSMVNQLCTEFADYNLYFSTIIVPSAEVEDRINSIFERTIPQHSNAVLIDWYGFAKTKPDLFYQDATHPNPEGAKVYAQFIAKNVADHQSAGESEVP